MHDEMRMNFFPKDGLDSTSLRLMALGCMLLDHLWATVVPGNLWMTCVGRLAFPIFAFQAVEGYLHTRDFRKYCLRLFGFGLVSEIPFDLMCTGSLFFPFHQNVMFTLLLGLLAIRQLDLLQQKDHPLRRVGLLVLIGLGGVLLFPDYGVMGVANVVVFYILRGCKYEKPMQLLFMLLIHVWGYEGMMLPLFGGAVEIPQQAFAVLALIPIWLYNGEKGRGGMALQYGSYIFYPAHMLLLGLLQYL